MNTILPERPTLKDVARAAGVSVSTASRALAENPAVATDTRRRIQKLAAELGYRPNAQARALQSSRSNTIGVLVPSLINHYFATMVTALQDAATDDGMATLITNSNESAPMMATSLDFLANHGVDGIICVPDEACADQLDHLHRQGMPLVLIDRELPGSDIPTVTSDPERGMVNAVGLLARHGQTPIGYLSGPMTTSTGRCRLETFRYACTEAGLEEQPVFLGGYEQSQGFEGANALLAQGVRSLFAGDSMMTIGVIEACHRAGLVIGEDVSVIGFDTQPMFTLQPRPLTVIDQHVGSMAREAFAVLNQLIAGKAPPEKHIRIPTTLIERQSIRKGQAS
ncbi:transcriptional regulator UriR [Corynebacterium guangdongense]|uniref:LacI family transcriptional regulator n=1 Tax=Corynebacterium guangdongense TaxID=1783348 RepID=A0ABU1ZTR5_9CORY|nr:LacI family DNA-binding transcriptional regulator [Corynebacterium guangdongense]MDR7328327.1 LacI family transcriptional regulator [Corynebacterium guangdongense]WJZ16905.1 Catabolite control protein A [Corynebacterium guangdongense]